LKNFNQIIKSILFLFLGVLLLWYILKNQDINKIITEFRNANYIWLLALFGVALLSHYFRALRWNLLINSMGYKTKASETFYAVMLGYIANIVFPRLGEITRCGVLNKRGDVPLDKLIGSVIAERLFDFVCLLIIIFFTILFQLDFLNNFLNKYIVFPLQNNGSPNLKYVLGFFLLSLIIMLVFIKPIYRKIKQLKFYAKVEEIIKGLIAGFASILKIKTKALFSLYTVLIWLLYYFMVYFSFFTLEGTSHLTVIDGFTILAIGSLGIVAPVPGGIGTYHWLIITALVSIYSLDETVASSYAFISHTAQMLTIIILGAFSYFMLTLGKKK